ncbi:unnamed protein product [Effrenium voratum]|uniref:Uncharacterized protein n=2 Tax=Effrenium voratum TaxID=2562239 RepID=A0AA36MTQ7_9DINO|nr:unnamed protein product [Effrenium voratum]
MQFVPGPEVRCTRMSSPMWDARETREAYSSAVRFQAAAGSGILVLGSIRPQLRARAIRRLSLAKPRTPARLGQAVVLALALFCTMLFADINPTVAEHISENVKQLEMQISQTAEATSHVSESTTSSAKTFFAPLLDRLAEIKVDSDTEDEYWVFGSLPFIGPVRILRKETSTVNVILCGLFAGFLVEFTNALTLHPLDTLKTRLQRGSLNQGLVAPDPKLLYERLYDGLFPVLATVPALSIFWAVKDIVRRSLIGFVKGQLPSPLADVLSSTFASACGEAVYVAVKTPGEVLKIEQQAAVLDEDPVRQRYSEDDGSYAGQSFHWDPFVLLEESLRSFPIFCTVDVPQVALRTAVFVTLHDAHLFGTGASADVLTFIFASACSSILCTPLDVARTQLILQREGVQNFPKTLWDIRERDGLTGLMAGWLPRLLWNGLVVGFVLGICRLQYEDARALFLIGVLDRFEEAPVH